MSNLVYLMSSLPSLSFEEIPPISLSEFNQDAKDQLSGKHFHIMESTDIQMDISNTAESGSGAVNILLSEVYQDISELRKAKRHNRQAKLERLPILVTNGNPLVREKQIMHYLWEELDSIESGKRFSMTELMVYKLKLQILWRLNSFNIDAGAAVLDSVVNPSKKEEVQ
ncbi:hypothetical protein BXY64_3596 [Marinifilum flexuosum]|uniref:Uncharacterized protein n=2 Tax=Marinifilum flexuosum TaxID=1117708 RepID=A0A419WTE5_9BACT|nr:hypothetical protein BXY64_3596 [Marinifilum flexuosum]